MNTRVIAIWSMSARKWDIYEVNSEYYTAVEAETSAEDLLMFVDTENRAMFVLRKNVISL